MVTSRDRALAGIGIEESDRVPVFDYDINSPVASKVLGHKALVGYGGRFQELCCEMLAAGKRDELVGRMKVDRVDLHRKLKLDIVMVRPVWGKKYTPPKHVGDNEWLHYGAGGFWSKVKYNPEYDSISEIDSQIAQKEFEGLEGYVETLKDKPFEIQPSELEVVEYAVKQLGGELLILGDVDGTFPIGHSWLPLFLKAMHMRPDLVKRFLRETTRIAVEWIKVLVDAGAEAISGGCDIAYKNGPYMSPKHFREFILPSMKEHANACHQKGVPYIKHTDGNIEAIEEDFMVDSNIDGYLAIEPRAGMDIGRLKEKYGDRVCMLGNIDCAYTLVYGSPQDVAKETRDCISAASYGGGHVVCSSNSIHSSVKYENFLTMIETAKRYGRHPMRLRRSQN